MARAAWSRYGGTSVEVCVRVLSLTAVAWLGLGGCTFGDSRQLVLDGPPAVVTDAYGPVSGPKVLLSDGSTPEGVTWTVSPDGVATLDGGQVTAVGPGEATITADWNGQQAQWTLKVEPAVQLSLVSPPATLAVGSSATVGLEARVGEQRVPADGVSWSSSDPAVLDVASGGALTGKAPGTAYVIVRHGPSEAMAEITVVADETDTSGSD